MYPMFLANDTGPLEEMIENMTYFDLQDIRSISCLNKVTNARWAPFLEAIKKAIKKMIRNGVVIKMSYHQKGSIARFIVVYTDGMDRLNAWFKYSKKDGLCKEKYCMYLPMKLIKGWTK